MAQLDLLAVQNAPVMRALNRHKSPPATLSALAEAVGRDKSNLQKTMKAMEAAGLVDGFALTEAGMEQLRAIGRAEHGRDGLLPEGVAALRHDQIRVAKHNARTFSGLTGEEIDALADTLLQEGLKQPPHVRPAGEDGLHALAFGERRWRAWGRLIERGQWEADRRILCALETGSDLDVEMAAVVENSQHAGLSNLEWGEEFNRLAAAHNLDGKQIAARSGMTIRYVQIAMKVAREAPEDAKQKFRAGEKDWTWLRDQVGEKKKPAIELPPMARVALVELAWLGLAKPTEVGGEPGYTRVWLQPTGGPLMQLYERKLINWRFGHHGDVYAKVLRHSRPEVDEWLKSIGFDAAPFPAMDKVREEVLGGLENSALAGKGLLKTRELNRPEPAERPAPPPAEPVEDLGTEGDRQLQPAPEPEPDGREPAALDDVHGMATGVPPAADVPAVPAPDDGAYVAALNLRLIMLETAAAVRDRGEQLPGGVWAVRVRDWTRDRVAEQLQRDRYLLFSQAGTQGWRCALSPTGYAWLKSEGYPVDADGKPGVTPADVYDAWMGWRGQFPHAVAFPDGCQTAWLNPPAAEAAAHADQAGAPKPSFQSPLGRQILDALDEDRAEEAEASAEAAPPVGTVHAPAADISTHALLRALRHLDHALGEAHAIVAKGLSRKLTADDARQFNLLSDAARAAAAPFLTANHGEAA
jgi:ParB/RepB/Spo0J family partition protein